MAEAELETSGPNDEALGAPDAAQRSLADALRISFALLRLLILVLVVVFLLSGTFRVKTGQVAVRLQLGELVKGDQGDFFYTPGGPYFAWPEPIDKVIRVPVTAQKLAISDSFWFGIKEEDIGKTLDEMPVTRELDPELDGFLVTADQNIMHGRWDITWRINERNAANFIRTVSASSTPKQMIRDAEVLLKYVAEQAIVATLAQHTADEFRFGQILWDRTRKHMQETLNRMEAGISVTSVVVTTSTPPLAVRGAFIQVDTADSGRKSVITSAKTARARVLGEAAGEAAPTILLVVAHYERLLLLRQSETDEQAKTALTQRAERVEKALEAFYNGKPAEVCFQGILEEETDPEKRKQLEACLKPYRLRGKAYETVEKARGNATSTVQAIRKEAEAFENRLKQYEKNPRVVRDRLWQETLNEIFAGDAERFYLPPGAKEIYIEVNRDPAIAKQKEREAAEAREKKAREKK